MRKKRTAKPDWSAIRKACEDGGQSFREIARLHQVSETTLRKKRKEWEAGASNAKRPPVEATAPDPDNCEHPESAGDALDHKDMVMRLYQATDQQIRYLEKQLQSGEAAYDEKEARMLGTIARTLEKIMDLDPDQPLTQPDQEEGKSSDDDAADGCSIDFLRQELTNRLDRLKQGAAGDVSGDAERKGTANPDL
ncbi:hypothetical protein [uncultured Cohaesibacter sp.]|uniref:hypothetical protein n=1 Tax=uncultured Cohaesibacter sp. TaxID=1002546 RepID=UPI00292FCEDD|nr:hypothetical protein [uncultured Cohaesibacter sp.]